MKILFMLGAIPLTMYLVGCKKQSAIHELQTSKLETHTPKIMTGGNGSGTVEEYTRIYDIHELNGMIDCIQAGKDCKVKSVSKSNPKLDFQLNLVETAIRRGTISSYFQGNDWDFIFPELLSNPNMLAKLQDEELFLLKRPSVNNAHCFVLSSSSNFNEQNILQVWYWTLDYTSNKAVIGSSDVYDRHQIISDDGTKVDCTTEGKDCNVGNITTTQQTQQLLILDQYLLNADTKGYFMKEKWTTLFPSLNDSWLNAILKSELKLIKLSNAYVLTAYSNHSLNNQNAVHTWMFQN